MKLFLRKNMKKILFLLFCLIIYFQSFADNSTGINPEDDPDLVYLRDNPNQIQNVPLVLVVMQKYGVPDLNEDGKVDCIDYSIWFRMLYGSNAKIIINNNPKTGMNHMFIRIWYNGYEIMDVEPQGTPTRYSMGLIWGMRYNPNYNKDVTSQWTHVVGGMDGR
ncbi:MAG: hypothetical protein FWG46_01870 [Treponema sp.]|nr:hypothetical protein [Treponema sp.]